MQKIGVGVGRDITRLIERNRSSWLHLQHKRNPGWWANIRLLKLRYKQVIAQIVETVWHAPIATDCCISAFITFRCKSVRHFELLIFEIFSAQPSCARSTAKSLTNLWKDRSLNLQLKSRLMQTLVWPVWVWILDNQCGWSQYTKCIWDGYVQKDDENQLDRTQDQQLDIRRVGTGMSLPGRS